MSTAATSKKTIKQNETKAQDVAGGEIEGVYVRSISERRCRAGFCFDRDGQGFAKGVLTDAQLAVLEADPLLKVEHCTFPAESE
ncbi:HI1506-related protein [Ectopseudomonas oleovorans]|uniref:Uncharacterized protein n=1 Tax=Ectopseudomonas oleovorans (strain CECT 5344) TaxID=1182590 RepID=W6QZY6_ECTO5|nr:HI1506-related protein [Pseudomonas oleovorans]CDM42390.1 hypothetical protein BN5_3848 [Pseudomonas oleovorans CECT 5344]CDR93013.1 hypothetical protein PPSAL_3789 [Pseudomonas oleovorans]